MTTVMEIDKQSIISFMENFEIVVDDLRKRANDEEIKGNKKLQKPLNYTAMVFEEVQKKGIQPAGLNEYLKELKTLLDQPELKPRIVTRYYTKLLSFIQKDYGYVTEKYYQNQWLAIGMAVFGIPFGMIFSLSLDNFAFIGIGLPIGMSVGIAIGTQKDKQAKAEGKQLQINHDF